MIKSGKAKNARNPRAGSLEVSREGPGNIEPRLAGILKDLARVLVANGYGIAGLSRLAKRAYFDAAIELGAADGGRRSHAGIAAATGLTRTEVSRMNRNRVTSLDSRPVNRAQRISTAWLTDRAYCDSTGHPSILPFNGKSGSFERLVKDYSGDIPVRAMYSEMRRLRMIRSDASNKVKLIRTGAAVSRHTTTALRALSPWIGFLSQPDNRDTSELHANSMQLTLTFESMPKLFAAVRELQSRATTFIDGIHELNDKKKGPRSYMLEISLALGTRVPCAGKSKTEILETR